jgi:hypothetical protein
MDNRARGGSGVPGWAKALIIVALLIAAGALMFSQLPQGAFPTDLSRIGQGGPALVVARDINYVAGAEVMDILSSLRPEYSDRVQFLAAHLGHPDGQAFARRYGMRDGTVVLFAGDGSRLATLHQPRTEDEVRRVLAEAGIR